MGDPSKHHEHNDAAAAPPGAAAPSEAATQVAAESADADSVGSSPGGELPDAAGESAGAVEGSSETGPEGNHQPPVELDLEVLVAQADKAAEYLELAQRTKADFENFRKRATRDAAAAQTRGVTKLALELLPAIDNLDRALAAADGTAAVELASGIKLVYDDILAALARAGIEPFSPQGEPFDPQHHEAVAQLPAQGTDAGTILEVYQRGYRLGDVVLRPARVSVAG